MDVKKNKYKILGVLLAVLLLVSTMTPAVYALDAAPADASAAVSEVSSASAEAVSSGSSASSQEPVAADLPESQSISTSPEATSTAQPPAEEASPAALPEIVLLSAQDIAAGSPFGVRVSALAAEARILLPENIQLIEGIGAAAGQEGNMILLTPQQDGSDILFTLSAKQQGSYSLAVQDSLEQPVCKVDFTVAPAPRGGRMATEGDSTLTLKVGDGASGFVDVDTIGNRIDWPYLTKTKQIQITANFGAAGVEKERTLEILVPRGYTIKGYSAKTETPDLNGVAKIALSQQDESKVASVVLTAADGSSWLNQRVLGYTGQSSILEIPKRVYDGKLSYTFNNNCDEITLTITLGLDQSVMPHNASIAELNPLTVKATSGSTLLNSQLSAAVSGIVVPSLALGLAGARNVVGEADQTNPALGTIAEFETSYSLSSYLNGEGQTHLADEVVLEVAYPAGLTLTGFSEIVTTTPKISLDQIDFSSNTYETDHFVLTNDPVNRIVTFRYKNVTVWHNTGSSVLSCFWTGVVDDTNIKWDVPLVFKATYKETSGLNANNQKVHNNSVNNALSITVKKPGYSLRMSPRNLTRRDLNGYADGNYPYDYMLGQFILINDGPDDAKDLLYKFTFHENLHVRGVSLPGLVGDTYEKITAYTNTGRQIELTNITVTNTKGTGPGVTLDSARLGLAADEYLLSLDVEQIKLTAGSYSPFGVYSVISYYGRFQNGQSGPATLQIFDNADASNPVLLVSGVDTTKLGWTNFSSTTSVRASLSVAAKNAADGSGDGSFFPNAELKFASKYVDNTGNTTVATQNDGIDPTVQIALPPGIELDASSVQGKALAGNYHGALFDLKLVGTGTKVINGETWNVYTFTGYNKLDLMSKAGHGFSAAVDPAGSTEMYVYFTAHVSSAAKTYTGLQASDIFVWDFGQGVVSGKVAPTSSTPINIVQKPGLKVNVGIRALGSGTAFHTYNGQEASIASITPSAPSELWLAYENTDSTSYKAGTEIYLPIPKKGHGYPEYFNNIEIANPVANPENTIPGWDSSLNSPISLPGFTTYYTTDTSFAVDTGAQDNSWTPDNGYSWSSVPPANLADVTMVKFVADGDISSGVKGETTFEITVSSDANLGTQNYWRTYQKGWRDATGAGSWMYGGIVAAEPSMNGIQGMLFWDKNANGVKDSGEEFANTDGTRVTAVLTGANISPLTLTMNEDGSFQSLNSNNTPYFLKTGTYTIQFTNGTNRVMGFTPATPGQDSTATNWKMNIPQDKIAADQSSATFVFTVDSSMTASMTQYVGLGLLQSPIITYKPGAGAGFTEKTESIIYGKSPKNNPDIYTNYITGYQPDSVAWVLDKEVTLNGETTSIPAGTPLTTAQLRSIAVTQDFTATANLQPILYAITYSLDGGTNGAGSAVTYSIADTFPLPIPNPQKPGYTFEGWTVDYANPALTDITTATTDYSIPPSASGDIALTAHWAAIPYQVTYHGNGNTSGAEPVDSTIYTMGQSAAVLGQGSLVRDHYAFSGWAVSAGAATAQYQENDTLTVNENVDLYAVWTLDTHAVKFYSNNANSSEEYTGNRMEAVPYDTAISAPANDPVQTGYLFAGWYTSPVGINPGDTGKWDFSQNTVTADTDLYAGWNSYQYTVTYRLNDGSDAVYSQMAVSSPSTKAGSLPATPERTGYTFLGWYSIASETGGSQFTADTLVTGDCEVFARWSDASVPSDVLSGQNIILYTDEVEGMTRDSYLERALISGKRFKNGSSTDISESDITVNFRDVLPQAGEYSVEFSSQYNGLVAITVKVIDRTYTVTYKFNNGAADITDTLPAGGLVHNPGNPTREDYTFEGWYNGINKWSFSKDVMPAAALVLEAHWAPVPSPSSSESASSSIIPPIPASSVAPASSSRSYSTSSYSASTSALNEIPASSDTAGVSVSSASGSASGRTSGNLADSSNAGLSSDAGSGPMAETMTGAGIPLGGFTASGVWSLLNLVLSGLCALQLAVMSVLLFRKRYNGRKPLVLINLLLAIATVLLFIFTTNFSLPMVFINNLTILFAVLSIVQFGIFYLYNKENRKRASNR